MQSVLPKARFAASKARNMKYHYPAAQAKSCTTACPKADRRPRPLSSPFFRMRAKALYSYLRSHAQRIHEVRPPPRMQVRSRPCRAFRRSRSSAFRTVHARANPVFCNRFRSFLCSNKRSDPRNILPRSRRSAAAGAVCGLLHYYQSRH